MSIDLKDFFFQKAKYRGQTSIVKCPMTTVSIRLLKIIIHREFSIPQNPF